MIRQNENGNLVVEFSATASNAVEYSARLRALIRVLQEKRSDMADGDDAYYVLDLLEDMLPSEEQCKMFIGNARMTSS